MLSLDDNVPFVLDRNVPLIGLPRGGPIGADTDEQEGVGTSGSTGAGAQQTTAGGGCGSIVARELPAGEAAVAAVSGGRSGGAAAPQRGERAKVLESFLGSFVGGFTLTKATVGNLDLYDQMLVLDYQFVAPNYAQTAGDLLLVRPRVLGGKGSMLLEEKERKYPVEFDTATLQTDQFDLTLPQGYVPDELPPPVKIEYDFATYSSQVEMVIGNVLRYSRTYQVKDVVVPSSRLGDLKRFYRQILTDEASAAVFKKAGS